MGKDISERDREGMEAIVQSMPNSNKSEKIRALDSAGYRPADIARFLGIRDQFVSNVRRRARSRRIPAQMTLPVGPGGRIVIPAAYREVLGVKDGGTVVLRLENGEVRLTSKVADIRRAQELVARYVPEGISLVDDLIAERRRETRNDDRQR